MGRHASIPTCGHSDAKHCGHGMCGYCYGHYRRGLSVEYGKELESKLAERGFTMRMTLADKGRWCRYRMTPDVFRAMLAQQCDVCAACSEPFGDGRSKEPHVDHDHKCCAQVPTCGKCTRGILCGRCNIVLGLLEEKPRLLPQYLLDYLSNFERKVK